MKMKLIFSLLIITLFTYQNLKAQTGVCGLQCGANSCGGFPDDGESFELPRNGNPYDKGLMSFININYGCAIGVSTGENFYTRQANEYGYPYFGQYPSFNVCIPFASAATVVSAHFRDNTSTVIGIGISAFKVIDLSNNQVVATGSTFGIASDGEVISNTNVFFAPNKKYRVEASLTYNDGNLFHDDWKNEQIHINICVGGPGDANSSGTYSPDLSTSTNCQDGFIHVDNYDSRLSYYWKRHSDPNFTYDDAHKFNTTGDATVDQAGDYDVIAYFDASGSTDYYSPTSSINVIVPSAPSNPSFAGGGYLCACNPASKITLGANSDNLQWYATLYIYGQTQKFPLEPDQLYYYSTELNYEIGVASKNTQYGCVSEMIPIDVTVQECDACINKFALVPGKKYVLGAWASDDTYLNMPENVDNFNAPLIKLIFSGERMTSAETIEFKTKGNNVEGWQRIEEEFIVPVFAEKMEIQFVNTNTSSNGYSAYFDDFRIHPFNSSMVSYVYNSATMQLEAQLDENNFYTRYIYDEEGNLVKTNVETIEGIRTAAETRSNIKR